MRWPAKGALVCSMHGGSAGQVRAQAKQRRALAEALAVMFKERGDMFDRMARVSAGDALEAALALAFRDMAFWRVTVNDLEDDGLIVRGAQGASMVHVYVQQANEAQERVARFSKLALDAGIDERRVRILEAQAALIAQAYQRFVAKVGLALNLDRTQIAEIRELMRQQILLLDSPEVLDEERHQ